MTGEHETGTILVVDDERPYTDAYERWLDGEHDVLTATGGEEALSRIDRSVDVAFLDRRMPGMGGDEVLERIREAGYDCRVAMLTAVEPDFDIIDMPFDEYLVKPVAGAELRETAATLLARATLDGAVQECYALAAKKSALESALGAAELETDPRYERLCERLAAAEERRDRAVDDLVATGEIEAAYHDVEP